MDTTDSGLDANYRTAKKLVGVLEKLHDTTQAGIKANDRTAKWLIGLTIALIILTAVIAGLTVALLVRESH